MRNKNLNKLTELYSKRYVLLIFEHQLISLFFIQWNSRFNNYFYENQSHKDVVETMQAKKVQSYFVPVSIKMLTKCKEFPEIKFHDLTDFVYACRDGSYVMKEKAFECYHDIFFLTREDINTCFENIKQYIDEYHGLTDIEKFKNDEITQYFHKSFNDIHNLFFG